VFRHKDSQFGEYPKYMLADSLTERPEIKPVSQPEVGHFKVCNEYGSLMQDNGIESPIR